MKKVKFSWGELVIVGATDELSVGVDIIYPGRQTDQSTSYLKKGCAVYYVLAGKGLCGQQPIKKGDLLQIKTGQKINLTNNAKAKLKVMTIYIPPYDEANIGR